MWQRVVVWAILGAICGTSGYFIGSQIPQLIELTGSWSAWVGAAGGVGVAFLTLLMEQVIKRIPLKTILGATAGLLVGLGIAKLASYPFEKFLENPNPNLQIPLYIILSAIFGYIGLVLGGKKVSEVSAPSFFESGRRFTPPLRLLDTSVIIDGRIADIAETGFLDGTLIVPKFVLEELQYIADSADDMRRSRGRRGLDILKRIQQHNTVRVEFIEDDVPKVGVDSKLVALAIKLHAKVLTNDFNLQKVAELQGVEVLSINQLANALKPAVIPGETLHVQILREGKSQGQGVAYLDDGTMVVIENAKKFIGKEVEVAVTSVLQTTAGRMIFTEIKNGPATLRKV